MPSINMKLEMVTIIACEVDTEVFTSDKMQVRSSLPKIPQITLEPHGFGSCRGRMPPHASAYARLRSVECRIFINGSRQIAKAHVPRRAQRQSETADPRRCGRNETSLI